MSTNNFGFQGGADADSSLKMGNLTDGSGGGGNFYMGDDGASEDQQNQESEANPELIIEDQGKEEERNKNRQYLEALMLGERNRPILLNPLECPPEKRDPRILQAEREEMQAATRINVESNNKARKQDKLFVLNA